MACRGSGTPFYASQITIVEHNISRFESDSADCPEGVKHYQHSLSGARGSAYRGLLSFASFKMVSVESFRLVNTKCIKTPHLSRVGSGLYPTPRQRIS